MRAGWFIYHVASGRVFFTGLALIAAAVAVATFSRRSRRRVTAALTVLGVLGVAISATPLPWFAYAGGMVVIAFWAFTESSVRRDRHARGVSPPQGQAAPRGGETPPASLPEETHRRERVKAVLASRTLVLLACLAGAGLEFPYHLLPHPALPPRPTVAVIGDSVTAGIGENEAVTWPRLLAGRSGLVVHDHAAMGATVASARKQAAKLVREDNVVLLEIGGNDLLGGTTLQDFAAGLDALLRDLRAPGRTVLMFELPLPPGFNAWGRAQRRLAAKYGVLLIPKRVLMGVFTAPGATLDSIHLSQAGHERMAEAVEAILGSAGRTGG